jgi:hypothetical protein
MNKRPRARWLAALGLLGTTLGLVACDLGPDGRSTITGTISGHPALGAAVLDVTMRGVISFEGRGSTQVYFAPLPGTSAGSPNRWRVVLISPDISELPFAMDVESSLLEVPAITVVEAANIGDLPVNVAELKVALER